MNMLVSKALILIRWTI